jgi:putative acetyltransferase
MKQVVYKVATLNEVDAVRDLFKRSVLDISNEYYSEEEKTEWAKTTENKTRWKEAIEKQYFLLAYLNQELVGFISLENKHYIDFIYVDPNFLGKGIANALYEAIESRAMEQNTSILSSHVSKVAIGFFQKKGFRILQENQNVRNKEILINYTVEKKL